MSERGPSYWVQQFGRNELPVLARTVEELERLRADADNLTPQRISALVLHDPLMTFKVLRYIQERRHRSQMVDITTISHALMMIGTDPFLGYFTHQQTLQSWLSQDRMRLAGRSRSSRGLATQPYMHATGRWRATTSRSTKSPSRRCCTICPSFCCGAGRLRLARLIEKLKRQSGMRSEAAQRGDPGFLDRAATRARPVMAAAQAALRTHGRAACGEPPGLNASLAVAVARHSANGWADAALPDDFEAIGKLLGTSALQARQRVVHVATRVAEEDEWYGLPPQSSPGPEEEVVAESEQVVDPPLDPSS